MKQRVKNISFLATSVIALANTTTASDVVALPAGAEVISVNLEVSSPADTGITASLGIGTDKAVFMNAVPIDAKKCEQSAVQKTIAQTSALTLNLSKKATIGEVIVRVQYFTPSEIVVEY